MSRSVTIEPPLETTITKCAKSVDVPSVFLQPSQPFRWLWSRLPSLFRPPTRQRPRHRSGVVSQRSPSARTRPRWQPETTEASGSSTPLKQPSPRSPTWLVSPGRKLPSRWQQVQTPQVSPLISTEMFGWVSPPPVRCSRLSTSQAPGHRKHLFQSVPPATP